MKNTNCVKLAMIHTEFLHPPHQRTRRQRTPHTQTLTLTHAHSHSLSSCLAMSTSEATARSAGTKSGSKDNDESLLGDYQFRDEDDDEEDDDDYTGNNHADDDEDEDEDEDEDDHGDDDDDDDEDYAGGRGSASRKRKVCCDPGQHGRARPRVCVTCPIRSAALLTTIASILVVILFYMWASFQGGSGTKTKRKKTSGFNAFLDEAGLYTCLLVCVHVCVCTRTCACVASSLPPALTQAHENRASLPPSLVPVCVFRGGR